MIKVNEKTEKVLNQMYNILIQNLFITYPKFLKEKEKHDNNENYQKWINMETLENYTKNQFKQKRTKVLFFCP